MCKLIRNYTKTSKSWKNSLKWLKICWIISPKQQKLCWNISSMQKILFLREILPIEIKSGKDYPRHVALNNLLEIKNYNIKQSYIFL